MNAPAYGLDDAPVAFRRPLEKYLLPSEDSPAKVGLHYQISPSDPCLLFAFPEPGGAVGTFATHIDDKFRRGEQNALAKIEVFLEYRLGATEL